MRQAAHGAVAYQRIAFQRAGIGLIVAHGEARRRQPLSSAARPAVRRGPYSTPTSQGRGTPFQAGVKLCIEIRIGCSGRCAPSRSRDRGMIGRVEVLRCRRATSAVIGVAIAGNDAAVRQLHHQGGIVRRRD